MLVTKNLENGVLTVAFEGKLDTVTTPQVSDEIQADVEKADKIVMDMINLNYISSAGLRLLLSLHKTMSKKGGMVIKNVNDTNMEIFEFTGFYDILNFE